MNRPTSDVDPRTVGSHLQATAVLTERPSRPLPVSADSYSDLRSTGVIAALGAVVADLADEDSTAVIAEESAALDLPEIWGHGSFPASDPPANW